MATEAQKAAKARYRESHREELRVKALVYSEQKRRAEGQSLRGSPEWRAKLTKRRFAKGDRHGNWKGAAASYTAHHHWIKRWGIRTGTCAECGAQPLPRTSHRKVGTEWANISGEYLRDLSDWIELCPPCHRRRDRVKAKVS